MQKLKNLPLIVIRSAGDIASGVALRLYRAGFTKILFLESGNPLAVRRTVAFSEAVYSDTAIVEGVQATLIKNFDNMENLEQHWQKGHIPLLVDPMGNCLSKIHADFLVDAILAKKNLGTHKDMAKMVIGLGPGFTAGDDVHKVVETMRGHTLGRVINTGKALANTGVPEAVQGYTIERVFWAEFDGLFTTDCEIKDIVKKDDILGKVSNDKQEQIFTAQFDGVVRGILRNNTEVTKRTKLGDVDPRTQVTYCDLVSDKGLAIGGGVLEIILSEKVNEFYA